MIKYDVESDVAKMFWTLFGDVKPSEILDQKYYPCPCCHGKGEVYNPSSDGMGSQYTTCKACYGKSFFDHEPVPVMKVVSYK